jgi:hypothetical protein
MFYSKRYAPSSGLNSSNLDFLPLQNIEEVDVSLAAYGAVPVGKLNVYGGCWVVTSVF